MRLFPDDAACAAYLERCRWPEMWQCPHCGKGGDPFRFAQRPGVLRCRACRHDCSLTAGTVMHRTHSSLSTWFWGAYLVSGGPIGRRGRITIAETATLLGVERYATMQEIVARLREQPIDGARGWRRFRQTLGIGYAERRHGPKAETLTVRFARSVNTDGPTPAHRPELGPCHLWTGTISRNGYGVLTVDARTQLAHRTAFFLADGRWPECALHHCDNPQCVRRSHLFEGDRMVNSNDKVAKGRQSRKLDNASIQAVLSLKSEGWVQHDIAQHLGVSDSLVSWVVRTHRVA